MGTQHLLSPGGSVICLNVLLGLGWVDGPSTELPQHFLAPSAEPAQRLLSGLRGGSVVLLCRVHNKLCMSGGVGTVVHSTVDASTLAPSERGRHGKATE